MRIIHKNGTIADVPDDLVSRLGSDWKPVAAKPAPRKRAAPRKREAQED